MKITVIFFLSMVTATVAFPQSATVRHVSVHEFKAIMDSLQDEIVLDLRTPEELKKGKIANALQIDFFGPDFELAIAKLDRRRQYLVYCASGGRSGETAEIMEKMGFKKIYDLEEGFNGWVKKKMPFELNR